MINGFTLDSNSVWISKKLLHYQSLIVSKKITIKDDCNSIASSLDHVIDNNYEYIFITGGLGPTHDDITKKTLSKYFKKNLIIDEEYFSKLKEYFAKKNIKNIFNLESQAQLLKNSVPIQNSMGTALGMVIDYKKFKIFVLPGVPKEMISMMEEEIFPQYIDPYFNKVLNHITILTTGVFESKLYSILKDLINMNLDNFNVSFLPNYLGVKIRLFLVNKSLVFDDLLEFQKKIEKKITQYIYGYNNDRIEEIINDLLIKKKVTLSIAESCTGGLLSKKITDIPGSSKYFKGSMVAYDNTIKEKFLDISNNLINKYGVVSEEIALEMAKAIKNKFKTNIGISTTGISGPDGGNKKKPVGLIFIAIATDDINIVKQFNLIPKREEHRAIAVNTSLNMLRKLLL